MNKLRTVILEDEDANRAWLVKKLTQYSEIQIVGEATTIDDAYALIATQKPDAAFMDIQLIGGDAFQLMTRLKENGLPIPYCVMTTGFPEYVMTALNDYRRYIVQYLLKPFVEDWQIKLRRSIDALIAAKLNDSIDLNPKVEHGNEHAYINTKGNLLRLDFSSISYLEAAGGGEVYIITDKETHQVDMTLNKFMDYLPASQFMRISKNNIVNLSRILKIQRDDRTIDILIQNGKSKSIGIGDAYYSELIKKLPLLKERTNVSPPPTPS